MLRSSGLLLAARVQQFSHMYLTRLTCNVFSRPPSIVATTFRVLTRAPLLPLPPDVSLRSACLEEVRVDMTLSASRCVELVSATHAHAYALFLLSLCALR